MRIGVFLLDVHMFSAATGFVANQAITSALWNIAESGVHQAEYLVHNYLLSPSTTDNGMDPQQQTQPKKIYYVSFNQDCTCLAVGHDDGYSFYNLRSLDRLEKISDSRVPERACVVEKLYSSSLTCVVSMKSTRKLQVYLKVFHSKKENEICSHTYASSIIAVRMNRKRVVVCLEDTIHIHNIRDMKIMHMLKDTPPNPNGIIDLSNDDTNCFLAFPCSSSTGHVHIFDAENLNTMCQITAHDGVLAAIRFNPEGNKMATASEKGTVIRVFSIPNGERLYEFTRGVTRYAQINSLAFSQDSRYLCLSSNTETVHLFALLTPLEQQQAYHHHHHQCQKSDDASQEGLGGWVSYLSQQASAYLPQHVNELMLREKSTATARLPILGTRTVVAIPRIQGVDYLMVASQDGYLFCYSMPTETNAECNLMRQYRIGPPRVGGTEAGDQQEAGEDGCCIEGTPVSIRSGQRQSRGSESEQPAKPTAAAQTPTRASMRAGSGGGSSSSLSSASAVTPSVAKQHSVPPPPLPPNPPKRNIPSSKSSTPVKETSKANANPFDMEDMLIAPLEDDGESDLTNPDMASTESDHLNIVAPPADLDDLDEFPPLA